LKKLITIIVSLAAISAVITGGATASAKHSKAGKTTTRSTAAITALSLSKSAVSGVPGSTITLTALLKAGSTGVSGALTHFYAFSTLAGCQSDVEEDPQVIDQSPMFTSGYGSVSVPWTVPDKPAGTVLYLIAAARTGSAGSFQFYFTDCQPFTVAAVPLPPVMRMDSAFLCYSQWEIDPGVWLMDQAKELAASGYWQPVAEKSIKTLTYIGRGYYLFCNGTKTGYPVLKPTGHTIGGGDGADLGNDYAPGGGNYPEAK
jgi:hypothetical protein